MAKGTDLFYVCHDFISVLGIGTVPNSHEYRGFSSSASHPFLFQMPVCSYFLKGICNNSNCPYSHVYVSRKAEVCQDFLKGYCPMGEKVKKGNHSLSACSDGFGILLK